jgi:hypothetical protein
MPLFYSGRKGILCCIIYSVKRLMVTQEKHICVYFSTKYFTMPVLQNLQEDFLWIFIKYRFRKRALIQLQAQPAELSFTPDATKLALDYHIPISRSAYCANGNVWRHPFLKGENDKTITRIIVYTYNEKKCAASLVVGTKFANNFAGNYFALFYSASFGDFLSRYI